MFVIDVQKPFSFGIICKIVVISFVLSSYVTNSEHVSINTNKLLSSNISSNANQMKKLLEENQNVNKNGDLASLAPATDSEVPDLIRPTPHTKSTLPPGANNIDKITEPETIKRANGRFNPTSGAIAAATCLSLAVVGYLGVVLWRNVIHRSYENREILLNEDDIGDINDEDMRHFEAACIEIEA